VILDRPKKPAVVDAVHWAESSEAERIGLGKEMGGANGERQIEIASRGAGVIEDARAGQAPRSPAHFACASLGSSPPVGPPNC
jgi:hypothetical protein